MTRAVVTVEQLDAFLREYAPEPSSQVPPPAPDNRSATPVLTGANGRGNASFRCSRYLQKVGPAVSGQRGHDRTYMAARLIWNDFGLDAADGYPILEEFNRTCDPPWSAKELRHKWDDAVKDGPGPEGRGWRARQDRSGATTGPGASAVKPPSPDTQPKSAQGARSGFRFIDSEEFLAGDYRPRWLVPRILVRGQPAVIAGPSKGMKTSLLIDLAVSMATATAFLGAFPVRERARVAVVSGESGEHTLKETTLRVLRAKGLTPEALTGWLKWEFTLPTFSDLESMTAFGRELAAIEADVVIIDPTYLALGDVDAKNLFEMGAALKSVASVLRALRPDLTVILVHHANRLLPIGSPMELQHLAYSGLEQFARQFILLNRKESYRNDGEHSLWVRVGGSTGHGGLWAVRISEGIVEEDFGGRRWDVRVETPEGAHTTDRAAATEQRRAAKLDEMNADDQLVVNACQAELSSGEPGATMRRIRAIAELSYDRAKAAVDRLLASEAIEPTEWRKAGQRVTGWRCPKD